MNQQKNSIRQDIYLSNDILLSDVIIQTFRKIYKWLKFIDLENLYYSNKNVQQAVEFTCQSKYENYSIETQSKYYLAAPTFWEICKMIYFEQESNCEYIPRVDYIFRGYFKKKRQRTDGTWYEFSKEELSQIKSNCYNNYYREIKLPDKFKMNIQNSDKFYLHKIWILKNDSNFKIEKEIIKIKRKKDKRSYGYSSTTAIDYYRFFGKYILWKKCYTLITINNFLEFWNYIFKSELRNNAGLISLLKIIDHINFKFFKIWEERDRNEQDIDINDIDNDCENITDKTKEISINILYEFMFNNYLNLRKILIDRYDLFIDNLEIFIYYIFKIFYKKNKYKVVNYGYKKKKGLNKYYPLMICLQNDLNICLEKILLNTPKRIDLTHIIRKYKHAALFYEFLIHRSNNELLDPNNGFLLTKNFFKKDELYVELQKHINPKEQQKLRDITSNLIQFLDFIKYSYCFIYDPNQYLSLPRGYAEIDQVNGNIIYQNIYDILNIHFNPTENPKYTPYLYYKKIIRLSENGQERTVSFRYHVLERVLSHLPTIMNLKDVHNLGYIKIPKDLPPFVSESNYDPLYRYRKKFERKTISMAYITSEKHRSYKINNKQSYITNGGIMNFVNWAIEEINKYRTIKE